MEVKDGYRWNKLENKLADWGITVIYGNSGEKNTHKWEEKEEKIRHQLIMCLMSFICGSMLIFYQGCLWKQEYKAFVMYIYQLDKTGKAFRRVYRGRIVLYIIMGMLGGFFMFAARIDHGWEENLENKPCKSEKQINTYYMKMGIHLFLCMLMSASDMHGENIIADGENPILLDLECLPGLRSIEKSDNAEKAVKRILNNSIIYTGILPLVIWISEKKGQGINLSALGTEKKQILPFKVPVLINKKTSEMRIVNRKIEIKASCSLPCFEGKYANPEEYADEIIEGFSNAYMLFMNKKVELSKKLGLFFSFESRYLIDLMML